tara:strand:- start:140 stop:421 length:282 start_codon:yes stop_codon:yes gene_type:complete
MANGLHKYTVQEGVNLQLGQAGFDLIAAGSTSAETGTYVAIYNSSTNNATIDATSAVGDSLSSFVLLSGDIIYGNFTSIDCDTADVVLVCYRG